MASYWLGICDWCRECRQFSTSAERDEWELEHRDMHDMHTRSEQARWEEDTIAGAIGDHRD